ncbi:hypothetical protein DUNSADRAFT_17425 [Dunaliella salina]|uniref:Encoded protein n=1 Tax=Dunaliella salina TaxID=3046 RepID=A0ABQ7H036_DUNSA|nr:hypothetical protein DUNSADRAFT_17425 [Dunaliella salina]|eukprot:KAF5840208.1 hypothetical protein DUNSADRAFT_17425 [Dunaliella salina]
MVEPPCILSEHVVAVPTSRLVTSTVLSCASATVFVGILHYHATSLTETPTPTEHGSMHRCSRGCLLWCMGLTIFMELLVLHHFMCRRVVQEVVRTLQGVGIVLESRSLVGSIISSQFVDEANIAGVIINEVGRGQHSRSDRG